MVGIALERDWAEMGVPQAPQKPWGDASLCLSFIARMDVGLGFLKSEERCLKEKSTVGMGDGGQPPVLPSCCLGEQRWL